MRVYLSITIPDLTLSAFGWYETLFLLLAQTLYVEITEQVRLEMTAQLLSHILGTCCCGLSMRSISYTPKAILSSPNS